MDKIKEQYGEDFVPPDFIKRKYSSMWNEDKNLLNFKVTKNYVKRVRQCQTDQLKKRFMLLAPEFSLLVSKR